VAELPTGAYPITFSTAAPLNPSRFWAIPIIGIFVKFIILIPHFIILYFLGIVVGLAQLVIWIFVLFGGRYPDWGFAITAGSVRWIIRIQAYVYGLSDAYPAFSMDAPGDVYIARPESSSRFWAIPIIGILVKYVILIPHLVVLYALSIAVSACQLVIWIWVLFGGVYPGWAATLVGGTMNWTARVYCYGLGLTDRYPPFSFT
jgi:uncharacterized protein DUF4389